MTQQTTNNVAPPAAGWRFKVGILMIVLIFVFVLLIPLSAAMGAPASTVATVTGIVFIGNKILLLAAIGVMGKAGFQELKRRMFNSLKPEPMVGVARYRIGLVMFFLPLLTAMLEPYIDKFFPGLRPNSFVAQTLGDAMLIGSFFVLGGNFWDKVRALFVRTATVVDTQTRA
jgi:hypothetical protein